MLEANKSRLAENIFAVYNKNLMRRRFAALRIFDLSKLNDNSDSPTIIYANHSSWWDGLVAFQISRQMNMDSFIMMEEKQLAGLFVFRKLGAFSVVREKPREAMKSLKYASHILSQKPNRTLWIFPQGKILPNDLRPIEFYNGLAQIILKTGKCRVFNLAIRYEFLGAFKPEIFVRIDDFLSADKIVVTNKKEISALLAKRLTTNLDQLKIDIINNQTANYQNII